MLLCEKVVHGIIITSTVKLYPAIGHVTVTWSAIGWFVWNPYKAMKKKLRRPRRNFIAPISKTNMTKELLTLSNISGDLCKRS